eukprot:1080452-Pleurochrysis_carterae.AAC.5
MRAAAAAALPCTTPHSTFGWNLLSRGSKEVATAAEGSKAEDAASTAQPRTADAPVPKSGASYISAAEATERARSSVAKPESIAQLDVPKPKPTVTKQVPAEKLKPDDADDDADDDDDDEDGGLDDPFALPSVDSAATNAKASSAAARTPRGDRPRASSRAASTTSSSSSSSTASVQFMTTSSMRTKLEALGYSPTEAAALDPERAAAILRHSIRRPEGGVPQRWNRRAPPTARGPLALARTAVRSTSACVQRVCRALGGAAKPLSLSLLVAAATALVMSGVLDVPPLKQTLMRSKVTARPARALAQSKVTRAHVRDREEESDLWLDRQVDRLIDWARGLR